jgi:hypothetical protein
MKIEVELTVTSPMNNDVIWKYRLSAALGSGEPEREVKKLLSDFEDSLLGCDSMPGAQFDFVVFFIETESALRLRCAAYLFLALQVEFYLLSQAQMDRLLDVVRAVNFMSGASKEAAVACADMIARNLDPERAQLIFGEADKAGAHEFSIFGVDVLRMRSHRLT